MKDFQKDFLEFVIANNILRFGEFTLKSGRVSPYFFNAGLFNTGSKLAFLANCYAAAIADLETDYDVLFGPAYKGIPLAATTALALATQHGIDKPYCFNRKEAKAHGEGGSIVGAELRGRVLIIDDVITAGTAVREAVEIIQGAGAELASIAVAMDRQEKGTGSSSAIQEIEQAYGIEIAHIISLQNIIDFLQAADDSALSEHLPAVEKYREKYGV
ncbi:MAG TPA: orotate phosphoribosyltransferase [Gammaproteobacteria bacterium]|jgi:orotate phosphoribosyltransferase|uniref:Orotate phosphoribosyltransferase n=1 Tax=OM182 bacterium TaxID=2510334 RepID=A0A520S6Z8_9GAMM|nr:orotate phosphoribosyltransferase [Pseudomonadales bacterium]RZO78253.1 MAG: orotate phosphoribosyltransferase [OM182 bacterium]HAO88979.1 orotate phosphoribosyltransferase [Gammaproteobacteria bacterium]MBL6817159.1 orotate phosphoribosyltransferase [Pseudomonadales bacterium]HAU25282.1 orotate phosphoribosyltransferase [Gammaproteobacteria bacterium]|tara:strand:- start:2926 stop:3573 length:648 start_codon:yes stop_codon:yes gene_type:complete